MSAWNEQNLEILKSGWTEGLSATQIKNRINLVSLKHVTRNAVLGKIHRLGLSNTRSQNIPRGEQHWNSRQNRTYTKKPRSARTSRRAAGRAAGQFSQQGSEDFPPLPFDPNKVTELQLLDTEPKEHERVPLLNAGAEQCRWPYDLGMVCGRKTEGGSFCKHHHRRAHFPKVQRGMHAA